MACRPWRTRRGRDPSCPPWDLLVVLWVASAWAVGRPPIGGNCPPRRPRGRAPRSGPRRVGAAARRLTPRVRTHPLVMLPFTDGTPAIHTFDRSDPASSTIFVSSPKPLKFGGNRVGAVRGFDHARSAAQ